MKIYNVLVKDRHCDEEIHNFRYKDKAMRFARKKADELNAFPDEMEETLYIPKEHEGWLLHIEATCEGDYVVVSEGELNENAC